MFTSTFWTTVITLAVGALFGLAPTYLIERRKHRYLIQTRWDVPLYDATKEFMSAARTMAHLCGRLDRATDRAAQLEAIDEQHARLRHLEQQIKLVGNAEVQTHAYWTVHHMYAVRRVAEGEEDKRLQEHQNVPALVRAQRSWGRLLVAVRRQLKVTSPTDLGPGHDTTNHPWTP